MVGARFLSVGDGSYKRARKEDWDEFYSTGLELETSVETCIYLTQMDRYRNNYRYVDICELVYIPVLPSSVCFVCWEKQWHLNSDTWVATNISSTQILFSNTLFSNKSNQGSLEKWLILEQKWMEFIKRHRSQLERELPMGKPRTIWATKYITYWVIIQSTKYIYISPWL